MSDAPDGTGQIRRSPRASEGGAPVSGALAIVLAAVAVVAGFLILRSISDDGENQLEFGADTQDGAAGGDETSGDADDGTATTTASTVAPTTTTQPFVTEGASVIVANANTQSGSASAMTRALETGPGFIMVDPVNAASTVGDIAESVIYFDSTNPAAEPVANSVGRAIGGVSTVTPLTGTPPTSDGSMNGADVLLMLGEDKANKTLEELNPSSSGGATTPTNPPVATETTAATG